LKRAGPSSAEQGFVATRQPFAPDLAAVSVHLQRCAAIADRSTRPEQVAPTIDLLNDAERRMVSWIYHGHFGQLQQVCIASAHHPFPLSL